MKTKISTYDFFTMIADLPEAIQVISRDFITSHEDFEAIVIGEGEGEREMSPLEFLIVDAQHATYLQLLVRPVEWEIYHDTIFRPFLETFSSQFDVSMEELEALRATVMQEGSGVEWFFEKAKDLVQERVESHPDSWQVYQNAFSFTQHWMNDIFAPQKELYGRIDAFYDQRKDESMRRTGERWESPLDSPWKLRKLAQEKLKKMIKKLKELVVEGIPYETACTTVFRSFKIKSSYAQTLLVRFLQLEIL